MKRKKLWAIGIIVLILGISVAVGVNYYNEYFITTDIEEAESFVKNYLDAYKNVEEKKNYEEVGHFLIMYPLKYRRMTPFELDYTRFDDYKILKVSKAIDDPGIDYVAEVKLYYKEKILKNPATGEIVKIYIVKEDESFRTPSWYFVPRYIEEPKAEEVEKISFWEYYGEQIIDPKNPEYTELKKKLVSILPKLNLQAKCAFGGERIWWVKGSNKAIELFFKEPINITIAQFVEPEERHRIPTDEKGYRILNNARTAIFILEDKKNEGLDAHVLIGSERENKSGKCYWTLTPEDEEKLGPCEAVVGYGWNEQYGCLGISGCEYIPEIPFKTEVECELACGRLWSCWAINLNETGKPELDKSWIDDVNKILTEIEEEKKVYPKTVGITYFDDHELINNTTAFLIRCHKPLNEEQIRILRNYGVRKLSTSEIENIYHSLTEEDKVEVIRDFDFVDDVYPYKTKLIARG